MPHRWTKSDDLAAFYVARYGVNQLPYTQEEVAARRGISIGSY
jgi:hypothetical protein